MSGEERGARVAGGLTRLLLLLYPPSFRREVAAPLVGDVGRRAAERAAAGSRVRFALWFLRLTGSLLANAPAAWLERLVPSRRGARLRRERRHRIAGGPASPLDGGPGPRASSVSWLDLKLGLRMLRKHPGLTFAGGFGIAVAIGASAGFFAFMYAYIYPTIPLDEGHRLVGLENWDLERNNEEGRSLHDFVLWREEMRSVEDMSAFRDVRRSLSTGEGSSELIRLAEMTPSGFDLARVPPYLGRTLIAADAEPGATDVLVIGYDVWRTRFAADPEVVGRDVRLGRVTYTIVGVMPEGFAFPMSHSYWIPLRERPADHPVGEGPSIFISGRLATGYTLADAKVELSVIGERMAAEFPETHARFRAQVMPYVYPLIDINQGAGEDVFGEFMLMNSTIALLLVLVGLNVAVLVYARTATRRGEIAVRTALGASRGRIVGQLFAESLVLSVAAAAVGLGLASVGLKLGNAIMATEMAGTPFWLELGMPGPALAYAFVLTILVAVLTGVVPGLQATSKRVQQNLRQYHGGAGLRLGRTWTTLIVVQVAAVVVGLPMAAAAGWSEVAHATTTPAYDVDRFLAVQMVTDEEGLTEEEVEDYREVRAAHLAEVRGELVRRIEAEPGVVAHTVFAQLPTSGARARIALEDGPDVPESADAHDVRWTAVHSDYFPAFDVRILAGRPLVAADLDEAAANVVVVDRTFSRRVLGGGDALGRRIRTALPEGRSPRGDETVEWHQIVGVAENMHRNRVDEELLDPHVYFPMRSEPTSRAGVVFKVAGVDPASLSGRVRDVVAALDPTLRVGTYPLSDEYRQKQLALALVALMLVLIAASVLLLSAAGIYALMSFAVSQRRREIGIRTALGAQRRRLLGGLFGRAAAQLGVGVALGVGAAAVLEWRTGGEALQGLGVLLLSIMAVVMVGVGLLATMGPARQGLEVTPVEALAAE